MAANLNFRRTIDERIADGKSAEEGISLVGSFDRVSTAWRGYRDAARQDGGDTRTDPLSGLSDREGFLARAQRCLAIHRSRASAVMLIDFDHFGQINDRYGPDCGDMVIRGVAEQVIATVRSRDVVGRCEGAGFIALLADIDVAAARAIGERIRKTVQYMAFYGADGTAIPVTVSVGIEVFHPVDRLDGSDIEQFIAKAGIRLELAKQRGRNRVVAPPPDLLEMIQAQA